MGGKILTTDFFSIITKNENLKNEKRDLAAKNKQLSKIVSKSLMKIKLLEKETVIQLKVIDQLKNLQSFFMKPSVVCKQHKSCSINHSKYNWYSSFSSNIVQSCSKPNQKADGFFIKMALEVDRLQAKYGLPCNETLARKKTFPRKFGHCVPHPKFFLHYNLD